MCRTGAARMLTIAAARRSAQSLQGIHRPLIATGAASRAPFCLRRRSARMPQAVAGGWAGRHEVTAGPGRRDAPRSASAARAATTTPPPARASRPAGGLARLLTTDSRRTHDGLTGPALQDSTPVGAARHRRRPTSRGWNWWRLSGLFSTVRREAVAAVGGPVQPAAPGPVVGHERPLARRRRSARSRSAALDARNSVHVVRHLDGVPPLCAAPPGPGAARPAAATRRSPRSPRVLDARSKDLHAAQMPAARTPRRAGADHLVATDRPQPLRSRRALPPGDDRPVGVLRERTVRDVRVTSAPATLERRARRSAGSRPVSRDHDVLRHAGPGPSGQAALRRGRPFVCGSSATASRKARANALNCVSTMWWGSRPASTARAARGGR